MQTFPLDEVLAVSCAAHRINDGFIKKDQVRFDKKYEKTTCNSDMLYNYFFTDKKFKVLDEDKTTATEVKEYLAGLSFKALERQLTEFESNVLKLVSSSDIAKDKLGIAASLPKVYLNKVEQDGWTDREMVLSRTSEKIGKLHQREKIIATVEFTRYIPRTMSYIVTCSVRDQHILKFFTDKKIDTGAEITVEGFVKSQNKGKYHNGYETVINRIKIHEDES
jgi:hypothetical protein|tara:strand:+ start:33 stop:698 length:666 start_codon:yes stop_codon:yes gene_type:complete